MDIKGKRAFVTGGSGDIGGAIARALAAQGVDVAISYLGNIESANKAVEDIKAEGVRGAAFQLDQRDPASIDAVVGAVIGELGGLDILVNNAGWNIGISFPDLETLTSDIWDRVLETNLRGPFLLSRAFASHLKDGGGSIINISSVGGISPGSSSIAYSSSKAGLNHLTRCLAVAMAPDVTVNCICPGLVEGTRMALRLPEEVAQWARDEAVLGKVGSALDIAEQIVAFCKTETITGQLMIVDGGMRGSMH